MRARLFGRARTRVYAGDCGVGGVVTGFVCERGASWCFGDARQTRIMERFTRRASNALDREAMH